MWKLIAKFCRVINLYDKDDGKRPISFDSIILKVKNQVEELNAHLENENQNFKSMTCISNV